MQSGYYAKWNKSDRRKQVLPNVHLYVESKKAILIQTESRLTINRAGNLGKWGDLVKGYKLPDIRGVSSGNVIYSVVTTVKNTVYVSESC